jgi:hypothetical protein
VLSDESTDGILRATAFQPPGYFCLAFQRAGVAHLSHEQVLNGFGSGTRLGAAGPRLVLSKFFFQNFLYEIRKTPIFSLSERN